MCVPVCLGSPGTPASCWCLWMLMLDQAPAVMPSGSCWLGRDVLHPCLLLCVFIIHLLPAVLAAWEGFLGRSVWLGLCSSVLALCSLSLSLCRELRGVVVGVFLLPFSFLRCCLC